MRPLALRHGPRGKPGADRAQHPRPGRRRRQHGGVRAPLSAAGPGRRAAAFLRRVISEPGRPAEAERAVNQGLVAADRDIEAYLEVGPPQQPQLVLDLIVALLDPVPRSPGAGCRRSAPAWPRLAAGCELFDLPRTSSRVNKLLLVRIHYLGETLMIPAVARFLYRERLVLSSRSPGNVHTKRFGELCHPDRRNRWESRLGSTVFSGMTVRLTGRPKRNGPSRSAFRRTGAPAGIPGSRYSRRSTES
jgi:hypothetical protein